MGSNTPRSDLAHLSKAELIDRLTAAEEGLFKVVQALGFDTDGAKTAPEFFGPHTYYVDGKPLTTPADITLAYAIEHRRDAEKEAEEADKTISELRSTITK